LTWIVLKVLGVWLIIDAVGSWLYDIDRINNDEMSEQKLVVHVVRFVRGIIGLYIVTV
jgi:hypothetical protein